MITKKYIAYLGVEETSSKLKIDIEIAGLKHAIAVAQERIANLEQSLIIAEFQINSIKSQTSKEIQEKIDVAKDV